MARYPNAREYRAKTTEQRVPLLTNPHNGESTVRRSHHFILDNEKHLVEVDMIVWSKWLAMADRQVARTIITDAITVSTVFVGLDMRHLDEGPPIVFETMILGGSLDQYMWRYSSWDDAVIGHEAAVKKTKKALGVMNHEQ